MRLVRERTDEPPGLLARPAAAGDATLPDIRVIHELWGLDGHIAPHAFFNDTRSFNRADAARDAWARTLGFFADRLAA